MIQLRNLRLQYGERFIFRDANASIGAKDRIGLIGSNGSGKTTMLKILAGQEEIDRGDVDKAKYVTIGYLPQDGIIVAGKTLYQEAESAFEDIISLNGKIEEASHQLQQLDTEAEAYTETLELIGTWERELENHDADKLPSRIEAVLHGLGFEQSDMDRPTREFSGGWQMRIALAKLLLASPSLLLLDEPTNHLDIISQRWLENYLKRYEGAILMVSHDRAFLDELCTRSWELTQGSLHIYQGNYSKYETQSSIRKEQLVRSFKNQQKEIERTEKFIDRFRSKASKATQVQSRIKALDKVERIEIETEEDAIDFSFPPAPRSGQVVIELENLSKSYGDLHVIKNASIRIERGDRIAVVGVNGAGKSTLAKVMAAVESFQDGERTLGHNTILSYFAQHQADELNPNDSVLETLENANTGQTTTQLRTALGAFLFHGDDVFKKTNVLSGGERNRLALSKILTQQANFLILDEPTNHLDIEQIETGPSTNTTLGQANSNEKKASTLSPKERRQRRATMAAELSPLKKRSQELESKIAALEVDQESFEAKMADPEFFKTSDAAEKMRQYDRNKATLDKHYETWSQVSDQLAEKEAALENTVN